MTASTRRTGARVVGERLGESDDTAKRRQDAYAQAVDLYTGALRAGGATIEGLGSSRWRLNPTPQDFAANVLAVAEFLVAPDPIPPGPCWHDSGVTWPGQAFPVHCELLAGHDGAHEAKRPNGDTAVWPSEEGSDG